MTDRQYLKQMIAYVQKLEHSAEAEPFDRQIFHDTVELMQAFNNVWKRSRRRRSWFAKASILFLLGVFAWLILSISC